MMRWRGWENAEIYDQYVRSASIYRWLNRELVGRSRLEGARRVLDLGCGTGATAEAALGVLPFNAELVGVDASPEMIAVARSNSVDPRARFLVGDAARADRVVGGPFDRVLSNAALWQFGPVATTLHGVAPVLGPDALLVFDVPVARLAGRDLPVHPFQVALARAVEARTGHVHRPAAEVLDLAEVAEAAAALGLELLPTEEAVWRGPQGELVDLMDIPAMAAPLAEELSAEVLAEAVDAARAAIDPDAEVDVPWLFVRLRRGAP